jgi:hypothetical protein
MKVQPGLRDTLVFTHLTLNPRSYVAVGSGTDMTDAGFRVEEGVHQGAVPTSQNRKRLVLNLNDTQ